MSVDPAIDSAVSAKHDLKKRSSGDVVMSEEVDLPDQDGDVKRMDHVPSSQFDQLSRLETLRKFWKVSNLRFRASMMLPNTNYRLSSFVSWCLSARPSTDITTLFQA